MMTNNLTPLTPYQRGAATESSFLIKGNLVSFLAAGANTGGRFALVEFKAEPGNEPPPHIHEWEHELIYVFDGTITLYAGNQALIAGKGELVFIPRGTAHAFHITSPRLRGLTLVVADGEHAVGMDQFFMALGVPATTLHLPEAAEKSGVIDLARILEVSAATGVSYLSPEEVAREMPQYPQAAANSDGVHVGSETSAALVFAG